MRNTPKGYSGVIFLIFALGAALFTYILIRAVTLSFTHDESVSFAIANGNEALASTANNHILNTYLMSVSMRVFGSSEIALRLPNILSYLLYFAGVFAIFKSIKNNWLFFLGISFALVNPFLVEFFSLARGYGMSLAFMVMSMSYLLRNGLNSKNFSSLLSDCIFSLLFAFLAVFSSLSMINYLICALILFLIKFLIFRKENKTTRGNTLTFISALLVACIPLYLGIKYLLLLKSQNQLYVGTASLKNTTDFLLDSSIYLDDLASWIIPALRYAIIAILAAGGLSIFITKKYRSPLVLTLLLIAMLVGGLILEHEIFDARYPVERTSLFLWPVLVVYLFHMLQVYTEHYKIRKALYIPVILFLITPLYINFLQGANFKYAKSWSYDAHTKEVMNIIESITKNSDHNLSISNDWLFEPTINYYISSRKMNLDSTTRKGVNTDSDFIYQSGNTFPAGYKIIQSYEDTGTSLLVRSKTND